MGGPEPSYGENETGSLGPKHFEGIYTVDSHPDAHVRYFDPMMGLSTLSWRNEELPADTGWAVLGSNQ
jgi:hypothetical protein